VNVPPGLLATADALSVTDVEDRPFAALTRLLAPSVLLSEDIHLKGLGLAGQNYRPIAVAARDLAIPDQIAFGANFGLNATLALGQGTAAFLRARPRLFQIALLVGAVGVGYIAYQLLTGDRVALKARIGRFVESAGDALQPLAERVNRASSLMKSSTIVDEPVPTSLQRVARILAVSPRPLFVREIVEASGHDARGARLKPGVVSNALRSELFLRTRDRKNQLGGWIAARRQQS
jgi:hypothetical protein